MKAENGEQGQGNKKHGRNGKNIIIEVPLGTIAKSADSNNTFVEILNHNEERVLLEGGIGGLGNVHFKSSTKQAPQYSQPGVQGIEEWINLELKVLADVGLVGFPNAGKSTLLSSISKAKPKIGDYPFTTLTPNLGVIPYKNNLSFIMADIPGIIEGASKGKGLGIRFLRHIERNSILLFMIPSISEIKKEFKLLYKELKNYNKELLEKKISITADKSQTTRNNIMGIKTHGETQIIFLDTPGIHSKKTKILNKVLNKSAQGVIEDSDLILFLVQRNQLDELDQKVLDIMKGTNQQLSLIHI